MLLGVPPQMSACRSIFWGRQPTSERNPLGLLLRVANILVNKQNKVSHCLICRFSHIPLFSVLAFTSSVKCARGSQVQCHWFMLSSPAMVSPRELPGCTGWAKRPTVLRSPYVDFLSSPSSEVSGYPTFQGSVIRTCQLYVGFHLCRLRFSLVHLHSTFQNAVDISHLLSSSLPVLSLIVCTIFPFAVILVGFEVGEEINACIYCFRYNHKSRLYFIQFSLCLLTT